MIRPLGWHALEIFQIRNQKICEEKKKKKKNKQTNWEEEDDKVGAVRSWNSNLATQHRSPITTFIFVLCFYFLFFLLFLLLLFLLSVETAVVSHLFSVWVGFEFFFSLLCFQWHWFMWLDLEESRAPPTRALALETRKLLIFEIGKMFQSLDLQLRACDVTIDGLISNK